MTTEVVINGQPYTDGETDGATLGMANGGHRENFFLLLEDLLTVLAAMNGFGVTSSTSISIGTGSKGPFTTSPAATEYAVNTLLKAFSAADPTKYMIGPVVSHDGGALVMTSVYTNGAGSVTDWIIVPYTTAPFPANAAGPLINDGSGGFSFGYTGLVKQGLRTIWVPATTIYPATTNGPQLSSIDSGSNDVEYKVQDFDTTTQEFGHFSVRFPKSWNGGTVTFVPYWTAASGSGGVVWALQGVALSNDDALNTAYGTEQTSTDTLITAADLHEGPASNAITIAGTPAAGDVVFFRIKRNVSDGSDTLGVDARLLGVALLFTVNAADDT